MKKKIFIMGKVYDTGTLTTLEIEKDVEGRLLDFTGIKIGTHIDIDDQSNSIDIRMTRYINNSLVSVGKILEQDTWLITGEGYQGFSPVNSAKTFPHFSNIDNYFDIDDVCKDYKKNALYYGASKVKDVSIQEASSELSLFLKY